MSTTLLTPEILTLETETEAASSRFFVAEDLDATTFNLEEYKLRHDSVRQIEDFLKLSEGFWHHNNDLIKEDVVYAWQVGIGRKGLCSTTDAEVKDRVSIIFDVRNRRKNEYTWQVIEANQKGRMTHKVTVSDGTVAGSRLERDPSGKLVREEKFSDDESFGMMELLTYVVQDPELIKYASERRQSAAKKEKDARDFTKESAKYGKALFEKRLKERQKQAQNIGFVAYTGL